MDKKFRLKKELFDVPIGTIFLADKGVFSGVLWYKPENWQRLAGWNQVDYFKVMRVSFLQIEIENNPDWFEEVHG